MSMDTSNAQAKQAALQALAAMPEEPVREVGYRSAGRLLIIGPAQAAQAAARRLTATLECRLLLGDGADAGDWPAVYGRPLAVRGHLGEFSIDLETPAGPRDLAQLAGWPGTDLVLDLSTPPLLRQPLSPPGYYAPAGDASALRQALQELPTLRGELAKPRYFDYDPNLCAHARSGITACRRCLDSCPAQAIAADGEHVALDANLCHGAGVCATACPTGAIRYAYPRRGAMLERLRTLMKTYREAGGGAPRLLFHEAARDISPLPDDVLPVPLEAIAGAGMDIWLTALAYGAKAVLLAIPPGLPEMVARELQAQVAYTQSLLAGMGYAEECVTMFAAGEKALPQSEGMALARPANFIGVDEKRTALRLALEHLFGQAPAPRPVVSLPAGAPFGEVWVDPARCTLCMACVSQCPAHALRGGDDLPRLGFIEENCVQCGLCARSCPENAIAPSPRYLYDAGARGRLRVLKAEEPFRCIRCGKPFATQAMITRVSASLRGHPMFQGAALERLKMCEDCRVKDMLRNEAEHLQGGQA